MKLSQRITTINGGGSDGWGVFYKARAMKADGIDVLELTIGEHDIPTDPAILDAMHHAARGGHTGYAVVPGIKALRQRIAARIASRTGVPTRAENIMVTPGGQAALFAAHMAVLNPGDTAAFIDPYYATYPGTIRSTGGLPRPIVTTPQTGFQPTREQLAAGTEGATSLLINSPNNPTGALYSADTMSAIAEVCRNHDLWLISDEVYDTQVWDGSHITPRSLPDMAERTIVVGSMSKSHAMTGSRIGWICAPETVVERLIDLATNTTYGVPGFIQDAAVFALDQGAALEEKVAAPFRRRRALTIAALEKQNFVKALPAQGAMYVMLDIRATGMSGEDFALALLEQEHIAVMPGESFGTAAAGHVRVAMTIADADYVAALERLIRFASQLASVAAY